MGADLNGTAVSVPPSTMLAMSRAFATSYQYAAELDIALGEGLTQGQATIVASVIALAAATIAFLGVLVKARYDKVLHREKLAEDRAVQRRVQATEALLEALEAVNRAVELVSSDNPTLPRDSDAYRDRDNRYYACVTAELKLQVLGLQEANTAMMKFTGWLALHWITADQDDSPRPHLDSYRKVSKAKVSLPYTFSDTLSQLDQSAPRRSWLLRRPS